MEMKRKTFYFKVNIFDAISNQMFDVKVHKILKRKRLFNGRFGSCSSSLFKINTQWKPCKWYIERGKWNGILKKKTWNLKLDAICVGHVYVIWLGWFVPRVTLHIVAMHHAWIVLPNLLLFSESNDFLMKIKTLIFKIYMCVEI